MTAHLLRDGYLAKHANESLAVLPDWTQWCLDQSDPGTELAALRWTPPIPKQRNARATTTTSERASERASA